MNERILNLEKNMAELTSPALSTQVGRNSRDDHADIKGSQESLGVLIYMLFQVENLKEELEYANQMFHDLSVFTNGIKTEVNEAKELLVRLEY